jgi:hypothetical protein
MEKPSQEIKTRDEVKVVEFDRESGITGVENDFRSDGAADSDNILAMAAPVNEGLPIQRYKFQNRIFLRRQIQLIAIGIPNSL